MNCPKCKGVMAKVAFEGIEVDRCAACDGIWFDALEKEHLAETPGAEAIDVGKRPADAGEHHRLQCPVCKTPMIPMVVQGRADLKYESCTVCFGAFMDAGEFREFKGGGTGLAAILRGLVGANTGTRAT
jgi:Zn-finger nucleic acid-binding protein